LVGPALFLGSCVIPAQEAAKNNAAPPESVNAPPLAGAPGGTALIKPTIPKDTPAAPTGDQGPATPVRKPIRVVMETKDAAKPQPQDWEDQKVKAAAMELARTVPQVKKIKLCYSTRWDEWWVTLYEDIGTLFDLRQFVWNREQEQFQPHLVQQRIAKSALKNHLSESDPERACEAIDPAPIPRVAPTASDAPAANQTVSPPASPSPAPTPGPQTLGPPR